MAKKENIEEKNASDEIDINELDTFLQESIAPRPKNTNNKTTNQELLNEREKAKNFYTSLVNFGERKNSFIPDGKNRLRLEIKTTERYNASDFINAFLEASGLNSRVTPITTNNSQAVSNDLIGISFSLTHIIYGNDSDKQVKFGIMSSKNRELKFYPEYTKN